LNSNTCLRENRSNHNASRRVRDEIESITYYSGLALSLRPLSSRNRSRKNAPVETATHHQSTTPKNDICSTTHSSFPFQVFRKYSHSLGPDELEYLEDVLERHDISDEDVETSIELIAKEYNKQDGPSLRVYSRALRTHIFIFASRCCHEGLDRDPEQDLPDIAGLWRSTNPERGRILGPRGSLALCRRA
jgi:hypothetical protein